MKHFPKDNIPKSEILFEVKSILVTVLLNFRASAMISMP